MSDFFYPLYRWLTSYMGACGFILYGGGKGGGSSAPPPDPRLIQAQIDSMGYQNRGIQQMMDIGTRMAPLQEEQMRFGLESAKTAYGQSQEDRQYALQRRGNLSGLQDRQLADANAFNQGDRANQLSAQAGADVDSAAASAQAQTTRGLARRGVNMSSGQALAFANQNSLQQTSMKAQASNMARTAARQEGYSLTDRAANGLAGYPSMGMSATGSGAGFGASGVGLANAGVNGLNSSWGAAGQAAGNMGSNATGMYNAQANYQTGMERAQGDGGAGMIVGLATAGATAF